MKPKFKIILTIIIFTLLSALAVSLIILLVKPASSETVKYVTKSIQEIRGKYGISISFDDFNVENSGNYTINNVNVTVLNDDYASINKVEIGVSFFQALSYLITGKVPLIKINLTGVDASLETESINLLLSIINNDTRLNDAQLKLKNGDLSVVYSMEDGLKDALVKVKNIDAVVNDFNVSFSMEGVALRMNNGTLPYFNFEKINVKVNVPNSVPVEIDVTDFTFSASSEKAYLKMDRLETGHGFVDGVEVNFYIKQPSSMDLYFSKSELFINESILSKIDNVFISLNSDEINVHSNITADNISFLGLSSTEDDLRIDNLNTDISYDTENESLDVKLTALSYIKDIGYFTVDTAFTEDDISLLFPYITSNDMSGLILQLLQDSEVSLNFKALTNTLFQGNSYLNFSYSDRKAESELKIENENGVCLEGNFNLDLNTLLLKWDFNFNNFYVHNYHLLIDLITNASNFYTDETQINGNLNGELFLDFNNPNVLIDTELSIQKMMFSDREVDFDFILKSELKDNTLYFTDLIVSLFDFEVHGKGELSLQTFQSYFYADVYNMSLGNKLVTFSLTPGESNTVYEYHIVSEYVDKFELDGTIDFSTGFPIKSPAVLTTTYQKIPLVIEFNPESPFLVVRSDSLNLIVSVLSGILLNISISTKNLIFNPFNTLTVDLTMNLSGYYNLADHVYSFYVDNLELTIPDTFTIASDISLKNGSIVITDMWFAFDDVKINPKGSLNIKYNSLTELLKGDTSSLDVIGDFTVPNSQDTVKISIVDNAYKLEVDVPALNGLKVSLLGARGSGFYADCSFGGFDFKLHLLSNVLQIFGVTGTLFEFNIDDLNINFEIEKFALSGSLSLSKILELSTGEKVDQKITLDFDITPEDIKNSIFSILGSRQPINIKLSIRDATLGKGFNLKDTDVILTYYDNVFDLKGELINGTFDVSNLSFNINVNKDFFFGMNVQGSLKDELNILIKDLYLPVEILNNYMDSPFIEFLPSVVTGDLLITGDFSDPLFYGSLFIQELKMKLFWLPDQILVMNNIFVSINANTVSIPENYLFGYRSSDNRFYSGYFTLDAKLDNLSLTDFELDIYLYKDPLDFWLPMYFSDSFEINIRGDVMGKLILWSRNGDFGIGGDITLSDFDISFKVPPNLPDWFYDIVIFCSMDLTLTMGNNVNFYYPDKDDSFLNFTFNEGEKITLNYDSISDVFLAEGNLSFKTGRIFYFHSDFIILDGDLKLSKSIFEPEKFDFSLSLRALLRQYDVSGERVDIYLVLRNSTLDNISPRLESIPEHTENELIQMLGNAVMPTDDGNFSISTLASVAASATSAFSSLGVLGLSNTYSLSSVIRKALGLDLFAIRSPLIENMVLDALPGLKNSNLSLVSRYFNGTSIYAGKYINPDVFAKISLSLRSQDSNESDNSMHFLADDLKLDLEVSFDWDNPLGSFSVFSQFQELSVIGFLDTIGFSFTRRFSF